MRRLQIWASLTFTIAALAGMAGFLAYRELQPQPYRVLPLADLPVSEWVEALANPSAGVRREAAAALEQLGPKAAGALLPLLGALRDDDMMVRTHAVVALGRLGSISTRPLTDALHSANVLTRRGAAGALALQMPLAASAAPLLVAALDDPDEGVRANAGRGLAALGTTAVYGPNERTTTDL